MPNNIFISTVSSVAGDASIHPNGPNTFLASGVSAFLNNIKPTLVHGPRRLTRNLPDWMMSHTWCFDSFILTVE